MPIQLEFVHDGLGVIYRCKGTLGLQHFSVANDQLLAAPDRIRKLKYDVIDAALMEPTFFSPSEMDGIVLQDLQNCIICRARIARCFGCGAECCFCACPDVGGIHRGNRLGDENLPVAGGSTRLGSNSCERQVQVGSSLSHCFNFLFRSRLCV